MKELYDRFRRFVFVDEDFGGFFLFLGEGFAICGDDAGDASREGDAAMPAAARKSPIRSSSSMVPAKT
jgi:hypothetical protein